MKKKDPKLAYMTAHGILIQFHKPLLYDLYIKDAHNCVSLMRVLMDLLGGKKMKPEDVNCCSYSQYSRYTDKDLKNFDYFHKKLATGIRHAFFEHEYDCDPPIYYYLADASIFGSEWHYGYGTLYRYREKARHKMIQEQSDYWNIDEKIWLKDIYQMIEPYIDRTGAPCPCN